MHLAADSPSLDQEPGERAELTDSLEDPEEDVAVDTQPVAARSSLYQLGSGTTSAPRFLKKLSLLTRCIMLATIQW